MSLFFNNEEQAGSVAQSVPLSSRCVHPADVPHPLSRSGITHRRRAMMRIPYLVLTGFCTVRKVLYARFCSFLLSSMGAGLSTLIMILSHLGAWAHLSGIADIININFPPSSHQRDCQH